MQYLNHLDTTTTIGMIPQGPSTRMEVAACPGMYPSGLLSHLTYGLITTGFQY